MSVAVSGLYCMRLQDEEKRKSVMSSTEASRISARKAESVYRRQQVPGAVLPALPAIAACRLRYCREFEVMKREIRLCCM